MEEKMGKKSGHLQWQLERGVRRCERNSPAGMQLSEAGGAGAAPGTLTAAAG